MPLPPLAEPAVVLPGRLRLSPLEQLWGIAVGADPDTPPLPEGSPAGGPRQALEEAVLRALRRPPCLVSFSGGVDSSTVLALAAHVARREGLPDPVPITNRFPAVRSSDENEWQELLVGHLGLREWVKLQWEDELDVLGPVATTVLRRHGLLFPFNSFFHHPMLERAAGGSLLTGIGGDELFKGVSRMVAARLLYERTRPRPRELRRLAYELSPRPLRVSFDVRRDRFFDRFAWIREPHRQMLRRAVIDWGSGKPLRDDRSLRQWWWPSRMLQCNLAGLRALASEFEVRIAHPLADPGVLAACAHAGGAVGLGHGSRLRGVAGLVADLLPARTLGRREKSTFDGVFWKHHARAFVARWDGSGLDGEMADPEALRAHWNTQTPLPHSYVLLQKAWLGAFSGSLGGRS